MSRRAEIIQRIIEHHVERTTRNGSQELTFMIGTGLQVSQGDKLQDFKNCDELQANRKALNIVQLHGQVMKGL